MKKKALLLLVGLALPHTFGCKTTASKSAGVKAVVNSDGVDGVRGRLKKLKYIDTLKKSTKYTRTSFGVIHMKDPSQPEEAPLHFAVDRFVAKDDGTILTAFYTFRDEDDGGNTFGWVEDAEHREIAVIADNFFEIFDEAGEVMHPNGIMGLVFPAQLTPAIGANDQNAIHGYVEALVKRYRGVPEQAGPGVPEFYGQVELKKLTCTADSPVLTTCSASVHYPDLNWDGELTIKFVAAEGQLVSLKSAYYEQGEE